MLINDDNALLIVKTLKEQGFISYYAGGCVRDAVLERHSYDIDIATDARPKDVCRLFTNTVKVGVHFGVVKVIINGKSYDVATFRNDGEYKDGRHPSKVTFSSPQEDAQRRDITINGMFYDPLEDNIIDYVNGLDDINGKVIRAIGDPFKRIEEDKLRIVRTIRFAGVLEFEIEAKTFQAVKEKVGSISDVSVERIHEELTKMLTSDRPFDLVKLLISTGLIKELIPEVLEMEGVEQPPKFHPEGDVLVHTMLMLELYQKGIGERFEISLPLSLSILFHDIAKPCTFTKKDRIRFSGHCTKGSKITRSILKRLKFPNKIIENAADLVFQHMKFIEVKNMKESTLKRFLRQENFKDHLALHWLDCMASHKDLTSYDFCAAKLKEFSSEEQVLKPPPLITGNDLIKEGYDPGPVFKEILTFSEDLQLEGKVRSKFAMLDMVQKAFPLEKKG